MNMEENVNSGIKSIGVIAGVIVILGVLVIGGQYMARLAGWVSADVVDDFATYTQENPEVTVKSEKIRDILYFLRDYPLTTDNAQKQELFQEYAATIEQWAADLMEEK